MNMSISQTPELLDFWFIGNELNPDKTSSGSHKKVWWQCSKGHKWKAIVRTFAKQLKCPYCEGKKAIAGETDLGTTHQFLVSEWNDKKDIKEFLANSGYIAEWKCNKNHQWKATIERRALRKQECPYCENYRLMQGFNDLATTHSELIKEWNDEKSPADFMSGSSEKISWKCPKNHVWEARIASRTKLKSGCPFCSGHRAIQGENDFGTCFPELLDEWNDPIDPFKVSKFSGQIIQWKCKKHGHIWKTKVSERAIGRKCPYCANKRVLEGFNDLMTTHPEIAQEWNDVSKKVTEITYGSKYIAQWKCLKNHCWKMPVCSRTVSNQNCPYCSGQKVRQGYNDLTTTHPEIAEEWDDNKSVSDFSRGSDYKANWKCKEYGHKWSAIISNRVKGDNCPYCSNRIVLIGFNDLGTTHPHLVKEWNDNEKITSFSKGSKYKAQWKCALGHQWTAVIKNRTINKTGCPYCAGKKTTYGKTDLGTTHPHLIDEWADEKNICIFSRGSDYYALWKCKNGHEWNCKINDRTGKNLGCPICSGYRFISGINDIATKMSHLTKEWDDGEDITKVYWKTKRRYRWICSKKHSYSVSPYRRSLGYGCPYCAERKLLTGYNDLATKNPEILKYWNFSKNEITPSEITAQSGKKIWWLCNKNIEHEWFATVNDVSNGKSNCPHCANHISSFEKEVNQFIKNDLKIETTTSDRKIISPKELDIVIEEKKIAIECNGTYWHSDAFIQKNRGISAKDHHQMKRDLAAEAGYDLFFVWENDWKDRTDQVRSELSNILNNVQGFSVELLNRLE